MGSYGSETAERLHVGYYFFSGETKIYNARPLLQKEIYSSLNNLAFFMSARACCGTVVWNDDVDIAPEHLYECSQPYSSFAS